MKPQRTAAEFSSGRRGRFRVRRRDAIGFDFPDPFYLGLTLPWAAFFATTLLILALINAAFATLFSNHAGAVQNLNQGDWLRAFFFSAETFSTVGYGAMSPADAYGHGVATCEMVVGLFFNAVLTGMIFIRFSRPKSHIVIASRAVVDRREATDTLQIRLANGRDALLTAVTAWVGAVSVGSQREPGMQWAVQELKLESSHMAILPLTWTLVHRIDEVSPLHGLTAEQLRLAEWRIYVVIEAYDEALGASVKTLRWFNADAIDFDRSYEDCVSRDRNGRFTVDLALLRSETGRTDP